MSHRQLELEPALRTPQPASAPCTPVPPKPLPRPADVHLHELPLQQQQQQQQQQGQRHLHHHQQQQKQQQPPLTRRMLWLVAQLVFWLASTTLSLLAASAPCLVCMSHCTSCHAAVHRGPTAPLTPLNVFGHHLRQRVTGGLVRCGLLPRRIHWITLAAMTIVWLYGATSADSDCHSRCVSLGALWSTLLMMPVQATRSRTQSPRRRRTYFRLVRLAHLVSLKARSPRGTRHNRPCSRAILLRKRCVCGTARRRPRRTRNPFTRALRRRQGIRPRPQALAAPNWPPLHSASSWPLDVRRAVRVTPFLLVVSRHFATACFFQALIDAAATGSPEV
jgi:hypothetical protein